MNFPLIWYFRVKPPTLSNPPSHRDLQDYFAHLETDFIEWTKRFVIDKQQRQWGTIPSYAKEMRFYTALSIQELEEENEENLRKGKIESLQQQLKDNQEYAMILTGQAGLGKTTSLRYLVSQDVRDYQPGAPIPIYLELKNASPNQSLFDWIVSQLRVGRLARVPQLPTLVEQWLEKGYLGLFLDGWNEIAPELEEQLFREVEKLALKYRQVFMMITIRETKPLFEQVPVFVLQDMSKEQVNEFIENNTDRQTETQLRQTIRQRIDAQPRFLEFIRIPLYALMLIQILRSKQEIPNNHIKVAEIFINRPLERDKLKWQATEKKLGMQLKTFAYLAYISVFDKAQQNTCLSAAEIRDILKEYQPSMASLDMTYQWLKIAVELGIMVCSQPEEKYSFTHQEYQDYFAGLGSRIFEG
jgi:predicted NACHT family NTPase